MITIIPASKKKVNELVSIENLSFNETDKYSAEDFINFFDEYPNSISLIKYDEKIVGYIMSYLEEDYYYLASIAIIPECRNMGISSQVLKDFVIKNAKALGCDEIKLHVDESNLQAINFYMKHNFNLVDKIFNYYPSGNNGLIMSYYINNVNS